MIKVEMNYGEEEYTVLTNLVVDSPKDVKKRKKWKVILIILGIFQIGYGGYNLVTAPNLLGVFCLVTAALAFFLAFGGERYLVLQAAQRKRRKQSTKENSGNSGHRIYSFGKSGCSTTSDTGTEKFGWDAFTAYGEYSHYLWIQRNDNRYILIDRNKLSSDDADLLGKICSENIPSN